MISKAALKFIHEKTSELVGQKSWDVRLGIGSMITLEFGTPITPDGAYTHGEWHLWVKHAAWRLETSRKVLTASEDHRDYIRPTIKAMENVAVVSITVSAPALETIIEFEGGLFLRLFPIYTQKYEHWWLFVPDGNVLHIGPGNQWSYHSATEP